MADEAYPAGRHDCGSDAEELELLERVMHDTPKGAIAVSLIAVALLLIGWLGMYFLVFLPRGTVG